ncbi:peptide chain release factor 1 [Buchnera aphidicola (Chaitoregma tattakana)]|uniref:peptide chain release factor 1 n=1 Tax=Buchnera aphidicola TaxID=9 RepID=UPI0031B80B1A
MEKFIGAKLCLFNKRIKEIEKIFCSISYKNDIKKFNTLSKEYRKLKNITNLFNIWIVNKKDMHQYAELMKDCDLYELAKIEYNIFKKKKHELEKKIYKLFSYKNDNNKTGCFIEIRSASGGDEASIFAGDLFRMYTKYSEIKRWKIKIVSLTHSDRGGFKEVIMKINGKNVLNKLRFESGGHRVQRIPKTESQGRTHTSTCTIAVIPEVKHSKKILIKSSDLKIDTFKSSGAGGQHVNTTDSAIRITHIPTGNVVECQNERSQHKNRSRAMEVLYARIKNQEEKKVREKNSNIRKNLLGSGDRSDRNRTYNFAQNRITDHRINLSLYCLDKVLNGALDLIIDPIIRKYEVENFFAFDKNIY